MGLDAEIVASAMQLKLDTKRIVGLLARTAPEKGILTHIGEPALSPSTALAHGKPVRDDALADAVPDRDDLRQLEQKYLFDKQAPW